jgi:predicted homoserine dehydrogenase-like protein
MTWSDARDHAALPLGLAERARALKPIKAGEALTYENCAPDDSLVVTQIRRRLDQSDARYVTSAAPDGTAGASAFAGG